MSERCHWWDAERGKWCAGHIISTDFMGIGALTTCHFVTDDKCPYCGAALPTDGPEEDGHE